MQMSKNSARLSEVIPTVNALLHFLQKENKCHFGLGTLKTTLREELENRFRKKDEEIENNPHYALATILDPKFKVSFFGAENRPKVLQLLQREAKLALKCKSEEQQNIEIHSLSHEDLDDPGVSHEMKKCQSPSDFWECFSEISGQIKHPDDDLEKSIEDEIQLYMSKELINRNEDSCEWWNKNALLFPTLKKLALKYLSAPASSIYSERLFSEASQVCDRKRSSLSNENFEKLVFLNYNLPMINFQY